jgi:hypothetical protein
MMMARQSTGSVPMIEKYIAALAVGIAHEFGEEEHLSSILDDGRNRFGLAGDELDDFVRRTILALLESGARTVRQTAEPGYDWIMDYHYGETKDEITEAILTEWKASGNDPDHWGDTDILFMAPDEFVKQ